MREIEYLFILGRNKPLSLAEIISYFKTRRIGFKIKYCINNALVLLFKSEIEPKHIIKDLGGTVKIGKILYKSKKKDLKSDLTSLENLYIGEKINYGISVYGLVKESKRTYETIKQILQKEFKKRKIKASLKKPHCKEESEFILTPTDVLKKKLLERGFELLVVQNKDYFLIAQTVAITDPREYKERDITRPVQRPIISISIQKAKILKNLSQVKPKEVLLDPFVGIGTILQEALIEGMHVIGVDIDPEAVKGATKNLEWIEKKLKEAPEWSVIRGDARKLTMCIRKFSVDGVATEPYLGPFIRGIPSEKEAKEIIQRLESLYENSLREIKKSLAYNGKIAMIAPLIRTKTGLIGVDFDKIIKKVSLEKYNPFKEIDVSTIPFNLSYPIALYKFGEHKVERVVYILEKPKIGPSKIIKYFKTLDPQILGLKEISDVKLLGIDYREFDITYTVSVAGKKFLLKRAMISAEKELYEAKKGWLKPEFNALKYVQGLDIAPKAYLLDDSEKFFEEEVIVIEKPSGTSLRELPVSPHISKIAKAVAKLHNYKRFNKWSEKGCFVPNKSGTQYNVLKDYLTYVLKEFNRYKERRKKRKLNDAEIYNLTKQTLSKIEKVVKKCKALFQKTDFAVVFFDLSPDMIFIDDKTVKFIGWEFSRISDPAVDIASFFHNAKIAEKEQKEFLNTYCSSVKDENISKRVRVYLLLEELDHMIWVMNMILDMQEKIIRKELARKKSFKKYELEFEIAFKRYLEFEKSLE